MAQTRSELKILQELSAASVGVAPVGVSLAFICSKCPNIPEEEIPGILESLENQELILTRTTRRKPNIFITEKGRRDIDQTIHKIEILQEVSHQPGIELANLISLIKKSLKWAQKMAVATLNRAVEVLKLHNLVKETQKQLMLTVAGVKLLREFNGGDKPLAAAA